MSTLVLRLQTNKGVRRLTLTHVEHATVLNLKQLINLETGIAPPQQRISLERGPNATLLSNNNAFISALKLASGAIIYLQNEISEFATQSTTVPPALVAPVHKITPLCQHNEMGRCLHCDPARKNGRLQEGEEKKCSHPPDTKCIHCSDLIREREEAKKTQNQNQVIGAAGTPQVGANVMPDDNSFPTWMCTHPTSSFCPKCIPKQPLNPTSPVDPLQNRLVQRDSVTGTLKTKVNFIPFKKFLWDSKPQCVTRHPVESSCPLCLPPPFPSYAFNKNCPNHRPYPQGQCTKCVPANITLRLQKYRHVDGISISQRAVKFMYSTWNMENKREKQRAWLLFGRVMDEIAVEEDPYARRAIVSAIYEPPQQQFADHVEFDIDSPSTRNAIAFAQKQFNSKVVGWLITTNELPTDNKYGGKALISCKHLETAAKLQWEFSKVLKVGASTAVTDPTDKDSYRLSEVTTVVLEHSQSIEPQAYMLSDQGMCMGRDGALIPSANDQYMLSAPVPGKLPVPSVIYHDDILEPGVDFIPDNIVVKVRVMTGNDNSYLFTHYDYPSNNTQPKYIKSFLEAHALEPMHTRLADFNLLLALSSYLESTIMDEVCKYLRMKQPFPQALVDMLTASFIEHGFIQL